jgi:hypothetical protein
MADEKPKYKKYVKDGKIAIMVSSGFGAGWYTWNTDLGEALIFDRDLIELILADKRGEAFQLAELKYPSAYKGGFDDIEIQWLPEGSQFTIEEYDGSESIPIKSDLSFTA